MRKPGFSYEANVEVAFESEAQAKSFAMAQTTIGEQVVVDLQDPAVLELFETGESLLVEVTFPSAEDEGVAEELAAAIHVGAEITVRCEWVKNA